MNMKINWANRVKTVCVLYGRAFLAQTKPTQLLRRFPNRFYTPFVDSLEPVVDGLNSHWMVPLVYKKITVSNRHNTVLIFLFLQ